MNPLDLRAVQALAIATSIAFVLTLIGADVGAAGQNIVLSLCSVAVLGAAALALAIEQLRTPTE